MLENRIIVLTPRIMKGQHSRGWEAIFSSALLVSRSETWALLTGSAGGARAQRIPPFPVTDVLYASPLPQAPVIQC